ncbi:response regulator transcription factor [Dinoroseobacter sp. S375]|uniref:response regulator transcription factor n=1 Tax=Dinoroseobacter sp. S375 TaxID=3415136 RepID=UPI003C7A8DF1
MKEHIVIVDDDQQVTSFLKRFFSKHGYRATGVSTSAELFELLDQQAADLVVLDLILPDEDGLDVARRLQQHWDVPIIMLSARDELYDRIIGLEVGADDYVTKPYEPRELLARVRSVLRRMQRQGHGQGLGRDGITLAEGQRYRFGPVEFDLVALRASRVADGRNLELTNTEATLLKVIMAGQGDVVTRSEILDQVYGNATTITDRAIDAHIVRLRRKLALASPDADLIVTVHGAGYRLAAAVLPAPAKPAPRVEMGDALRT